MAFPTGWTRQCNLTIQHIKVTADQTAFPVLLTEVDFPSEMLTLAGGNAAQSDGGDIRFSTDSAGASQLPCEIVIWTQNATPANAKAEIYVPVSVLAASDVDIYVWYNAGGGITQPAANTTFGSQAVWDSNYKGVWHLPNGTSLTAGDSTSNNDLGTVSGSIAAAAGKIDGGASGFAVGSNWIDITNNGSLQNIPSGDWTMEGWVNPTSNIQFATLMVFNNDGITEERTPNQAWGIIHAGNLIELAAASTVTLSTWQHVVATKSGSTYTIYINGSSSHQTLVVDNGYGMASIYRLGGGFGTARYTGAMDEMRLSSSARSSTWISTEYNNQNSPGTFVTVGTPGPVTNSNLTQAISDTNTLSDGFVGGFGIFPSETLSFSDTNTSNYGLILLDADTFSDGLAGNFGLLPNETLNFSDGILSGYFLKILDTEVLSDAVADSIISILSKSVPYDLLVSGLNDLV